MTGNVHITRLRLWATLFILATAAACVGCENGAPRDPAPALHAAYTVAFFTGPEASAVDTQTVENSKQVTQPIDPTREGYVFAGWYYNEQHTMAFDFGVAITKSITLYARWSSATEPPPNNNAPQGEIVYTVSFDLQGGSTSGGGKQQVKPQEKASRPSPDPVRVGYIFAGWLQNDTDNETFDFDTPIAATLTLYARWDEYQSKILFGRAKEVYDDISTPTETLYDIAVGPYGELYFYHNGVIYRLDPDASTAQLQAGAERDLGYVDNILPGGGIYARFKQCGGMAIGSDGNLYVVDQGNQNIRKIDLSSTAVSTLAGSGVDKSEDGIGSQASFKSPSGIAADGNGYLYVTQRVVYGFVSAIRRIRIATGEVTSVPVYSADPLTDVVGIAVDGKGSAYVTEGGGNGKGHRIRKVNLASGIVSEVAGATGVAGFIDGKGAEARFNTPTGIAIGQDEDLYVADTGNNSIRKIAPDGATLTIFSNRQLQRGFYFSACTGIALSSDNAAIYASDMFGGGRIRAITVGRSR